MEAQVFVMLAVSCSLFLGLMPLIFLLIIPHRFFSICGLGPANWLASQALWWHRVQCPVQMLVNSAFLNPRSPQQSTRMFFMIPSADHIDLMWSWSLNVAFKATFPLQGGTRTFQNLNPYFWFWVCFHSTRQGSAGFQKGSRNLRTFMVCKNWGVNGDFFSILIFWNPVLVGFMSWKPKLCKDKQINTWNHLKYVHWIYNIWKFNFLNGIMEINQLFHDILILWPGSVYEIGHFCGELLL